MNSNLPPMPPGVSVDQPLVTPLRPPAQKGKQLQLVIRYEDREPSVHPLMDQITTIGRRKDNDIVIPFDYISGHHAQFQRLHDGAYQVMDLGSQNGTSINGKKIRKGKLQPGDILVFGILGGILEEVDATTQKSASTPLPQPASEAAATGEVRDEYNRLLEERKRLQEEREELRQSIERMKREREAAQGQTVPVQNRESAPAGPPAAPLVQPDAPAPTSPQAEAEPEGEEKKLEELHDEVASIDSRRILIRSNVKRLEDQIEEGRKEGEAAEDPEAEGEPEVDHKQEIESMKSDLSEKEEELETFLSRLNTARIEPDEYDDTTDEFKEILGDFDQLCSELETKVQRLEGELRTKLGSLPEPEEGAGEENLAESGAGI